MTVRRRVADRPVGPLLWKMLQHRGIADTGNEVYV